jgi:hypothetical protein
MTKRMGRAEELGNLPIQRGYKVVPTLHTNLLISMNADNQAFRADYLNG